MSDSNYTYLEAATRRKKKNQVVSILIIIAVVLVGVAIWGVREHKKSEAAERIKNALNSQAEPPAFVVDTVKTVQPPEVIAPEPVHPAVVEATPVVTPEVTKPAVAEVKPKVETKLDSRKAKAEAARLAAQEKAAAAKAATEAKLQAAAEAKAAAAEEKKVKAEASRLAAEEKAAAAKAAAEAKAQSLAEAKAKAAEEKKAKAEAAAQASAEKAAAAKAAAEAKIQAAAEAKNKIAEEKKAKEEAARIAAAEKIAAAKAAQSGVKTPADTQKTVAGKTGVSAVNPTATFAPEDSPLPDKSTGLSEEGRLAMTNLPKAAEIPSTGSPGGGSETYKQGLNAYRSQDYANASSLFGQLPKPVTKRRGDPVRDEYVQGQFMRGVSMMRTDHTSEAVMAFQNVLEYEKFYPLANMNLGICYVDMKQYAKGHRAFEAVVRDQGYIDPANFDEVMQRTRYFWALAWTRMYKASTDPDKKAYYQHQAILHWKDYLTWFSKNDKFRAENKKAEDYLKNMTSM